MKQDYFRVENLQELVNPQQQQQQQVTVVIDSGKVKGDDSMMYVVKENRATKTRSCQIFREIVKEVDVNYYQHLYEDNLGKPLLLIKESQTVYFISNRKGLIEKVQLAAGKKKDIQVNWINVNIDHILGMFSLNVKFDDNSQKDRTYDLVLGTDANSDAMMIIADSKETNVQPSRSLSTILQVYDTIAQVEEMHTNVLAMLAYSQFSDAYHIICVQLNGMKFERIDTYKFKKGQKVQNFSVANVLVPRDAPNKITAEIIAAYSGSKLVQFSFGANQAREGRRILKLHHNINFRFKVSAVISLSNTFNDNRGKSPGKGKYLVQADSDELHLFTPTSKALVKQSQTENLIDATQISNSVFRRVFKMNDQILIVSQDQQAKTTISTIKLVSSEAIIEAQLKAGNLMTALNIVYSTGRGQKQLVEYQLRQKKFSDLKLLETFLEVSKPGCVQTLKILEVEEVASPVAIQRLLEHAKKSLNQSTEMMKEEFNAFQIFLHTRQQRLIAYKQAFSEEAAMLEHEQVTTVSAQAFIIKEDFLTIVNTLLYSNLTQQDDSKVIRLIFEEMFLEAIENYSGIIKILPLENLNPASLLPYLPPGRSAKLHIKPYWQKARSLIGDKQYRNVFIEDSGHIFETLSVEYCYDLDLPGKALVILKEALQNREILNINLPWVALEAIERAYYSQKLTQDEEFSAILPEERKERCKILFKESIAGAFDYFKETQWVFSLSKVLYDRFLLELKSFIQNETENSSLVQMILEMAEGHQEQQMIALNDQDVVHIIIETIYTKLKITDDISQIKQIAANKKNMQETFGSLSNLKKSKNQQAFIDKHLKKHFKFAEIANGRGQGQNLMKDIEKGMSFGDLLRLQCAPNSTQNVAEVESMCRQMIKSQLVGRVRVRDQVYKMGMRTGTKIFDKGKNFGKQGLMKGLAIISKSNVGGVQDTEQDEVNEESPVMQQSEFKWVQLYQNLNQLLACIDYDGTIIVEKNELDFNQEAQQTFSLDQIVMEEVLQSKDPQVIRHLLQHAEENPQTSHIKTETLYMSIIGYIKKFYTQSDDEDKAKTASASQFFEFYTGAKAMLDLLHSYSTTDPIMVMNETRLLEAVSFMTQNNLLDQFPLAQIRVDFFSFRIIERILQMHGLDSYPRDYDTLVQLQGILGQPMHHVAMSVLDHFEKTHYLDELEENDITFVFEMIVTHLIRDEQTKLDKKLAKQILKVLRQDNSPVILSYLISKIDKESEEFTQICKLKYLQDAPNETQSHFESLERALGQDLPKKALYYFKKPAVSSVDFKDLCVRLNFPSKEAVKRLCKVTGETDCLERVTDLLEDEKDVKQRSSDNKLSIKDLIQYAIIDPSSYDKIRQEREEAEEERQKQVQASDHNSETEQNPIHRLIATDNTEMINSILVIDFTDERTEEIDVVKIYEDLFAADIPWLGASCSKVLLQNQQELLGVTGDQATAIQALIELAQVDFNVLNLHPSIKMSDFNSLLYSIPQFQNLQPTDELFLEELTRHISEHNIYQVSYILENHANLLNYEDGPNHGNNLPNNVIAPLLLYINKLELVGRQLLLPSPNIPHIYSFITKETLEGLLLQTEESNEEQLYQQVKKAVAQINNKSEMQVSHKIQEIKDRLTQHFIVL